MFWSNELVSVNIEVLTYKVYIIKLLSCLLRNA